MTASLELKNIIKKYGEKPVINNLSFEAAPANSLFWLGLQAVVNQQCCGVSLAWNP